MTEIAQLFESALRQNQAKAAMSTVARMPPETTLRELLDSDAGEAVRALSLRDLAQALRDAGYRSRGTLRVATAPTAPAPAAAPQRRMVATGNEVWPESREERIYRRILDAMAGEPLTIGQLAKRLELDVAELRGYLNWMKKMGKVASSGRARATRYRVA